MTTAEFDAVAEMLDHGWKGDFGEEQERVYRRFLGGYELADVEAALHRLARNGSPWLPTVPEIVQAIEEPTAPKSWTSALYLIRKACSHYGPAEEHALAWIEEQGDRYIAAFVRTVGYDSLRTLPLDDPQWGGAEQRRLEQRYADFCESARERARDGRALAAVGRRSLAGLQQPNFAAALSPGEETPAP